MFCPSELTVLLPNSKEKWELGLIWPVVIVVDFFSLWFAYGLLVFSPREFCLRVQEVWVTVQFWAHSALRTCSICSWICTSGLRVHSQATQEMIIKCKFGPWKLFHICFFVYVQMYRAQQHLLQTSYVNLGYSRDKIKCLRRLLLFLLLCFAMVLIF